MCILSTLCNEGKSHVFIYLIPLDDSFIVETYFPVYHFKLILQNLVILLITLVNESGGLFVHHKVAVHSGYMRCCYICLCCFEIFMWFEQDTLRLIPVSVIQIITQNCVLAIIVL